MAPVGTVVSVVLMNRVALATFIHVMIKRTTKSSTNQNTLQLYLIHMLYNTTVTRQPQGILYFILPVFNLLPPLPQLFKKYGELVVFEIRHKDLNYGPYRNFHE